jgi:hypothetical protein
VLQPVAGSVLAIVPEATGPVHHPGTAISSTSIS